MAVQGLALVANSFARAALRVRIFSQTEVSSIQQRSPPPRVSFSSPISQFLAQTVANSCLSRQLRRRPYGSYGQVAGAVSNAVGPVVASASVGDVNEAIKDAVKEGDVSIVKQLLADGNVDINRPSPERSGWTALHLAAFYEHPEITQVLLDAGADTEARSNTGNTPLQFACLKGNVDIARMLLDAGADLYATSDDKGNALEYAQEWGTEEMVDFLLIRSATDRNEE